MSISKSCIRDLLDRGEFQRLFNTLGWDNPPEDLTRVADPESDLTATLVAQKRGVGVWLLEGGGSEAAARRRLDHKISRLNRERLLICTQGTQQLWFWPEQRPSGGYRLVSHSYLPGTLNEDLIQRLSSVAFLHEEETSLTVVDVLRRVRRSFSAEKVTKKFFTEFQKHHQRLKDEILGIPKDHAQDRSWYCSILLNRLMFVYFLQRKGFLDDDNDYLSNKLKMVREKLGRDAVDSFFRRFLRALFHEGLGSHKDVYSDPEIARIIGDVPYVGGGFFQPHPLEQKYVINIPDKAFGKTFDFFAQYRWHLDERPTFDPNEINPEVLGHIFEKYVNQKEQGAYYTGEDITGYMAASTVIPAFFDKLSPPARNSPWVLLGAEPDRYIFESLRHGADDWIGNADTEAPPPPIFFLGRSLGEHGGRRTFQEGSEHYQVAVRVLVGNTRPH